MSTRYLSAVIGALVLSGFAGAEEFTVAGTAQGAWNGGSIGQTGTLLGLTYTGSTFSDTTSNGFVAFGGDPNPGGGNFNNFGSISLGGQSALYNGNTFSLRLTFSAPTGIAGGGATTFTANVTGQVSNTTNGGVQISWGNNGTSTYTFANNNQTGSFTLNLNPVAIAPGKTVSVTGYVTGQAAVPEPATMAGVGLGLLALVRRRRKF